MKSSFYFFVTVFVLASIPSFTAQTTLHNQTVLAILHDKNFGYDLFAASHPTIAFFLEEPQRY